MAKRQRKPRQTKPVKLSFPVFEYNPKGLKSKPEKELRKEYSRLRSIARKRIERMAETEFARTETFKYNVNRFKQLSGISSNVELRHLLVDLTRFLLAEGGSVTGQREIKRRSINKFRESGFDFVNEENYLDWIDFLHYVRDMEGFKYGKDEESVRITVKNALKESFKQAIAEGVESDAEKAYKFYMQNTGRGAHIPSA